MTRTRRQSSIDEVPDFVKLMRTSPERNVKKSFNMDWSNPIHGLEALQQESLGVMDMQMELDESDDDYDQSYDYIPKKKLHTSGQELLDGVSARLELYRQRQLANESAMEIDDVSQDETEFVHTRHYSNGQVQSQSYDSLALKRQSEPGAPKPNFGLGQNGSFFMSF